jgi:prophage regulatory protein
MKSLHRIRAVCDRTGLGRATVYEHVANGTMTPPVRIGPKWSAWPSDEIDAILTARAAGWPDDQIRALVTHLVALRLNAAPEGSGESSERRRGRRRGLKARPP